MLKTSVERLENSSVKLTVTVPAEKVDASIEATYKRLSAKYRFPGFRPGKAPKPILEQQLGREYILGEATEAVVNDTYPLALDAEKLRPVESPEMEELDLITPGEDFTYVAEIIVRPELTLSDTKAFKIEVPPREATTDEIDEQIEQARERFASLEPVEDRGLLPDDFALISFVGTVDGEPYEGNEVDKYLYEMGRGLMPEEFDSGLVGAKPGDERHIEFDIPDTSANPEFAGKKAGFDVTVHEIKSKKLPALDDEFASTMGGFENVDELIEDLRQRIDLQKGPAHDRLVERRLRELLAERLEGEVPEAMFVQRQSTMMRDFLGMLEGQGITVDQYLQGSGIDMDTLEKDIAEQSRQSVHEELALEALFRDKELEVTDADLGQEFETIATATNVTVEEARKRWEDMGLLTVMLEQLQQRKAVMWLLDNAEIVTEGSKKSRGKKEEEPKPKKSRKKKTDESADEDVAAADEKTEE